MIPSFVGDVVPWSIADGPFKSTGGVFQRGLQFDDHIKLREQYIFVRTRREALDLQYAIASNKSSKLFNVGWESVKTYKAVGGGYSVNVWFQFPPKDVDTLGGAGSEDPIDAITDPAEMDMNQGLTDAFSTL